MTSQPKDATLGADQALQQAVAHHKAGRLQDAERLYRDILRGRPNHPDANHNLGVLAVQSRQPSVALPYFKSALESNPNHGQYWLSYIDALIRAGQAKAARHVLEQGRKRGLQGEAVEALAVRLGRDAHDIEQSSAGDDLVLDELISDSLAASHPGKTSPERKTPEPNSLANLSTRRPVGNPGAHEINTLMALMNNGQYTEAQPLARSITAHFPTYGPGWKTLGVVLMQLGRTADALKPMQKAAELLPNDAEVKYNLGVALKDSGRIDEAVASYRSALKIRPDYAMAHCNLGVALQSLRRLDDAVASYRRALEIKPDYAMAHYNLGVALQDIGQLEEAVESYRRALKIEPNDPEAHGNLGVALQILGQIDAAVASYRRALEIRPDSPNTRMNLGNAMHALVGKNSGRSFFDEEKRDFQGVRMQYENLPFPARDPEAERYLLRISVPDILGKVNQYCFGGSKDYSKAFRILVAGCGTGDSVIWLAHQLKDTQAEIVALDMSEASLAVARARAKVRDLTNISWISGSLLDVPSFGLGRFDYISCLGVLHHLPDPVEGLIALESVLANDGAMAIMLYGAVSRSPVYAMQEILRQLTIGLDAPGERLAFAKNVVAKLPETNGFRKREGTKVIQQQYLHDDTNFWDTLLHAQDRAYTASEVREFLSSAGLFLQAFVSYQGVSAITGLQYELDLYVDDASQRERLKTLSLAERQNLAEALDGGLALHTVYATRSPQSSLDPTAPNAILSPMSQSTQEIIAHACQSDQALSITLSNGLVIPYKPSAATRAFLARIDGHRSNAEIADLLGIKERSEELTLVVQELRIPVALHWVVARTRIGSYLPPLADRTDRSNLSRSLMRHYEPAGLPI